MKLGVASILMIFVLTFAVPCTTSAQELPAQPEDLRLIANPPEPADRLFRIFAYGMYVAAAGDAASTEWSLRRPENFERNPLMANRGVRLAAHVVAPAASWWATERMRKQGHRRAALILRIGITAGYSYLTLHNINMAIR